MREWWENDSNDALIKRTFDTGPLCKACPVPCPLLFGLHYCLDVRIGMANTNPGTKPFPELKGSWWRKEAEREADAEAEKEGEDWNSRRVWAISGSTLVGFHDCIIHLEAHKLQQVVAVTSSQVSAVPRILQGFNPKGEMHPSCRRLHHPRLTCLYHFISPTLAMDWSLTLFIMCSSGIESIIKDMKPFRELREELRGHTQGNKADKV